MEQEYRDRLTALRSQTETESEVLLQQVDRERAQLQKEVDDLRVQEASLQEEVAASSQVSAILLFPGGSSRLIYCVCVL